MTADRKFTPVRIDTVEAIVLRAPIKTPIKTSFGSMKDRPALVIRISDKDGAVGWGEVWCNFPVRGAEHRGNLIAEVLGPLLVGSQVGDPSEEWRRLTKITHTQALQSGELGPFAQAIAGIDIALWDLAARRAGLPLWRMLSGNTIADGACSVPTYASGINPDGAVALASVKLAEGYRAFKVKVGFGAEVDVRNLRELRELIGPERALMADANQAWNLREAQEALVRMGDFGLGWLEEPLAVDAPASEWEALAQAAPFPLAGGENIRGFDEFDAAVKGNSLAVIQPDAAKWGGITGCLEVALNVVRANRSYCPHYLAGGIGLAASAHLLGAVGGPGLLEMDANPNPLIAGLWPTMPQVKDGMFELPEVPGLGVEPDKAVLSKYRS